MFSEQPPPGQQVDPCQDQLSNCQQYGKASCTGQYTKWAQRNCERFCGYCSSKFMLNQRNVN